MRAHTHTHTQQIDQYQWYQSADKKVNKKVDKNSYEDILIYYIGYESSDGLKPLHIIFYKINWYIEDNNGPKYLKLIPVDENKGTIKIDKKYGIKHFIEPKNCLGRCAKSMHYKLLSLSNKFLYSLNT